MNHPPGIDHSPDHRQPVLRAAGLARRYAAIDGGPPVTVFEELSLTIARGELVAIVGASGSGKSTLLHLLGGLDRPTEGRIEILGFDIVKASEPELSAFRNQQIGFVFQFHHLLPEFTAIENIAMPLLIAGSSRREAIARAGTLLARVGLADRAGHRPGELSGGEQQRVALARALVRGPALLLADEPTGNLDQPTGDAIFALLRSLRDEHLLTGVIVTHNEKLAAACDRTSRLRQHRLEDWPADR